MSCIFGVDIIKGSIHGKRKPSYAVFILKDDDEYEKVASKSKLFRMIRQYKPNIVSFDNILEVFGSKEELIKFLKEIPSQTKLVQVSSVERGPLPYLSKRYGLKIDLRNPMDEAKASAYLASFGIGDEISMFVDKTIITVSRNRSLGKGGWRQNKYRRKVHDSVRQIYKEIKRKLDEMGLEYEEEVRKGYGGISKGVLIVNASKSEIPINSFKTRDVQVKVEAVEKDRIEYIPLKRTKIHTIVGIDPGTTTAVAILDLNGNLLGVKSQKNWKLHNVIDYILSFGKPIVIATDKNTPPDYVLKIKAAFNAILYTPKEDISVEKKKNLASHYKFVNDHERDAIAAAKDAFNSYKNKLMSIEKRIPTGFDSDKIKAEILKGVPLKDLLEEKKEVVKKEKVAHEEIPHEEIIRKEKLIKELEEENKILRDKLSELKNEIERLRSKIVSLSREEHEKVRKDNYIRSLEAEIAELRKKLRDKDKTIEELNKRIEVLKRMKFLEFSGWKGVKVLRKFTKDEIERVDREYGIDEGDIIYIEDSSGGGKLSAELICDRKVKAVIVQNEMSHLAQSVFDENEIPIIYANEVEIESGDGIAVINAKMFNDVLDKKLEEINRRKVDKVEKLFLEYKSKRQFRR